MIRGTAAVFKFKLPYAYEELGRIYIQFWQQGNPSERLPIIKTKNECSPTSNPNEVCVSLSAAETAIFSDKYKAKTQLNATPIAGAPFGSKERLITVYPMSDDIIDDSTPLPSPTEEGWIILDGDEIID